MKLDVAQSFEYQYKGENGNYDENKEGGAFARSFDGIMRIKNLFPDDSKNIIT